MEELQPNQPPNLSREDCMRIFVKIWDRPALHLRAAEGNWLLMFRNDLDGKEDSRGGGDAKML